MHFCAIHFGHRDFRGRRCVGGNLHEQAEAYAQYSKGAQDGHATPIPPAGTAIKPMQAHRSLHRAI